MSDIVKEIGTMIREARQEAGLTQADLAERLGHRQSSYLSRVESGEKLPGLPMLERLAFELGAQLVVGFEFPGGR